MPTSRSPTPPISWTLLKLERLVKGLFWLGISPGNPGASLLNYHQTLRVRCCTPDTDH